MLFLGLGIGTLGLILTGWFLVVLLFVGVWSWTVIKKSNLNPKLITDRLEDIATWTELLRDLLSSSAGLAQTIVSSYEIAPLSLKPGLFELSQSIKSGKSMAASIQNFADWLNDPVGDLVCMVLINAAEGKAFKIANLLGDLAESTRQEVTMQLRVEASRSSTKASMNTIIYFSASFFIALAILAKSYMQPYRTLMGQIVLLTVMIVYLSAIFIMKKMSGYKPKERLLV